LNHDRCPTGRTWIADGRAIGKDEKLLVHGDAPQRVSSNEPSVAYAACIGILSDVAGEMKGSLQLQTISSS
jgi:hypothetical protein